MTKKQYSQPSVEVSSLALETVILTGSPTPAPAADALGIKNVSTDDVW